MSATLSEETSFPTPSEESVPSDGEDQSEYEWVVECGYDPPHEHRFPMDWQFGGADGTDWRADERWQPSTYFYFDDRLHLIHMTQVPACDDEAIDLFTWVASLGTAFNPVWLRVKRPDGSSETLPVTYNKQTDEVYDNE